MAVKVPALRVIVVYILEVLETPEMPEMLPDRSFSFSFEVFQLKRSNLSFELPLDGSMGLGVI